MNVSFFTALVVDRAVRLIVRCVVSLARLALLRLGIDLQTDKLFPALQSDGDGSLQPSHTLMRNTLRIDRVDKVALEVALSRAPL